MEGGGEGMVAIVQGLHNAGLSVTVLKGRYQDRQYADDQTLASILAPRDKCYFQTMSSAHASTQSPWTNHMPDQNNDRYASTYQLAHCSIRPSSSPVYMSEFPQQRPEPSRTKGNFVSQSIEQGSYADVETPVRDIQPFDKRCTWLNTGIQSTASSKVNEAFADSLRRYPLPPERANSSDFVAQLLAHTQAKNTINKIKSPRPHKDKVMDTSSDIKIKSKNMQTYTRMKNEKDATASEDMKFSISGQPKKRIRLRSPINYKPIKYKDNQLNETYDYLKSTSPTRYAKPTEVRYLEDVSRCIKDTLRQFMNDRAVECPQIQSRYNKHRRDHHRKTSAQQTSCISTCSKHPSICHFCNKPLPCKCNILPSSSLSSRKQVEDPATHEKKRINELWKDQIFNWLQDIPVYANITPEDKEKRKKMVEELANILMKIKNDEDFEVKARKEVMKCLNCLPMWTPSTKTEEINFRAQIFNALIHLLKNFNDDHSRIHAEKTVFIDKDEITSTDKLKSLVGDTPVDDNKYNEKDIKINTLDTFKEIPTVGHKKNNLSDQSASKLKTIFDNDLQDEFEIEILDWHKDISDLSEGGAENIRENKGLTKNLAQKLQCERVNDEIVQEQMQDEIKDWLELAIKEKNGHMNSEIKKKLTEKKKLKDATKNARKATSKIALFEGGLNKDYLDQIRDWFADMPNLLSGNKSEMLETIKSLATKLQNLRSADVENEDNTRNEISKRLVKETENKVTKLSPKSQDQLANSLLGKMHKKLSPRHGSSSSDDPNESYLEQIWDWFQNIPELAKYNKSEMLESIKFLATKLQNLHSEDVMDEEEIQYEISSWLVNEAEKKKAKLNTKIKNQLAKKLLAKIKKMPPPRHKTIRSFEDWAYDEVEKKNTKSNSKTTDQSANKLVTKVKRSPVQTHRFSSDENKAIILSRKHWDKVNTSNEETDEFFVNVEKTTSLLCSFVDLSSRSVKNFVKEEINNILEEYQLHNRGEIQSNLTDVLHNQIMRDDDDNTIRKHVFIILKDANISDNCAKKLTEKLMDMVRELSLTVRSKDSTMLRKISILPSQLTPLQKQIFQDCTERTILNFIEEITGNQSLPMRKIREETEKLVQKLSDVLADPNIIIKEKENTIRSEVLHFLEVLALPQKDLVAKLTERIENVAYKTSTPRGSLASDISFYPKNDDTSISAIKSDAKFVTRNKEETNFVADLITAIRSWTNEFIIDLNTNEILMNTILQEFAEEIAERQKYLQLHSRAKISKEEELEYLKYQVFRCLNKVIDKENLLLIMAKVEPLMIKIRKICAPQLSRTTRQNSNTAQIRINNLSGAVYNDISKSIEGNLVSILSANIEENVKDLTNALQQVMQNSTNMHENIQKEISERGVLKDPNKIKETGMIEYLKNRLKDNSMKHKSNCAGLSQSSSQFVIENLTGAILDFLKSLPLYQKRNYEEKNMQEKLSAELAISLQKLLATSIEMHSIDFDTVIINEILNYLKMFPLDPVEKADDILLLNIAQQLLDYLKKLQLFQDISTRNLRSTEERLITNVELPKNLQKPLSSGELRSTISFDVVKDTIFDWLQNIPLQTGKTANDMSNALNTFSKHTSHNLSSIDAFHNKSRLQEELVTFLKQLPIQMEKMDDKYLQNIVEQLINKIKETTKGVGSPKPLTKATDILHDWIKNWCNELPIAGGSAPEEIEKVKILKQNLANRIINKVTELNMNPETFQDNVLYQYLLQDEIDNMFTTMSLNPELDPNLAILKANLIGKIIENKQKMHDEFLGQTYKKQLREIISTSLPYYDILTSEEQISFEDLKNSLADAYINLHFVAGNIDQKIIIKKKIADEIEIFSNNYLRRHPDIPLDTAKISKDLYSALKKVPIPKDAVVRSEVEQVKISDEINHWVKELPLKKGSTAEKVKQNKAVEILANRLYEIKKEKELHPEINIDNKLEKEIFKWLKKLPLKRPGEGNIIEMTEKLMNKLKSTKQSRRISASTTKQSIEVDEFEFSQANPSDSYSSRHLLPLPASTLTVDDRAQLEKIRQRTIASTHVNQLPHEQRDASVSPLPVDAANQTEVGKDCLEISNQTQPCTSSNAEVSPKIIIKEYFWDTNNSKLNESVYRIPCLSNKPSSNINTHATPSHTRITCPRSTHISSTNDFMSPNQISPCLEPVMTRPSLQMSSSAIQNERCRTSTQIIQNQSPCMPQQDNPNSVQKSCLKPPSPGTLNRIRSNCIRNQQSSGPKADRQITSQEQSSVPPFYVPLSSPCMPPITHVGPIPSSVTCMPPSTIYMPPNSCQSREAPLCTTTRQRAMKRNNNVPFRQPRFSLNIPENTSIEINNPEVESSRCLSERATKLGLSDDVRFQKPCRRLNANISIGVSEENSRWTTVRLPDDKGMLDAPCCRPKIYKIPCKITPGIMNREQKMRDGFRDRAPTSKRPRSRESHYSRCESCERLRRCSKCCGISCPHPNGFYFS